LRTQFAISVDSIVDEDLPVTYKFGFYFSWEHYMLDIINGTNMQFQIISDYSAGS
jgi:hypothetical protein